MGKRPIRSLRRSEKQGLEENCILIWKVVNEVRVPQFRRSMQLNWWICTYCLSKRKLHETFNVTHRKITWFLPEWDGLLWFAYFKIGPSLTLESVLHVKKQRVGCLIMKSQSHGMTAPKEWPESQHLTTQPSVAVAQWAPGLRILR